MARRDGQTTTRPSPGNGPQRYIASAVSADGCSKQFTVSARSESLALLMIERFLKKHWSEYTVAKLVATGDAPSNRAHGIGAIGEE